jgi:RNA polymerase sigma factor (sigma-70 family)
MTTPNPETLTAHLRTLALAAHPAGALSDAELLRRYATRSDEAAFEVLVWRHGPLVWSTCRRVLRHHQDAEDAFQATFLALARHAPADRPHSSIAAWLHRVACNAALKVKQRRRPTEILEDAPGTPDPDPSGNELRFVVDQEVQRLPDHYRVVFVLSCLEGMSNAEVARALGCPVGTIDSRLHAARTRLRQSLARRGLAPDALGSVTPAVAVPSTLVARAIELGTTATLPPPGIDQLATELGRTMLTTTRALTLVALVGFGLAATVWALATPATPPAPPPATQPDPPALTGQIGSPEFRHPKDVSLLGTSADGKRLYTSEIPRFTHDTLHLYVWDTATGRLQAKHAIAGGANVTDALGFSPDGVRVLERDESNRYQVHIVEPDTGKSVRTGERWSLPVTPPVDQFSPLEPYTFSTDAQWMIRSDREGYRLFNLMTGKETRINAQTRGQIPPAPGTCGFTPDGRLFYTRARTRDDMDRLHSRLELPVRLYELPSGKHLGNIPDAGNEQHPVALTPDGKHLLLWVWQPGVWVWSLDAYDLAAKTRRTILDKRPLAGQVHFAPDGTCFALLPSSLWSRHPAGDWEVRDFATGKELGRVPAASTGAVLFSPDGSTLFTKTGENLVVPWDVATGQPTAAAPRVLGPVERFRFTGDGKLVGLAGGFVYSWDAKTTRELSRKRLPRLIDRTGAVTFDLSGNWLHFSGLGDKLVAWNFDAGTVRESPVVLERPAIGRSRQCGFTPDGSQFVEQRDAGMLVLRDPATGKETARITLEAEWLHQSGVSAVALSADGRRIAIGGNNSAASPDQTGQLPPSLVGVLNVDGSGKPVTAPVAVNGGVSAIALSPDGRFLVATNREKPAPELGVWLSHTGRRVATITLDQEDARVNAVRFSPDGRMLAVSLDEHEVLLVETVSWRVRARVTPRTRNVFRYFGTDRNRDVVAWSPDGQQLATATLDGGLMLWAVRKLGTAKAITDVAGLDRAWAALGESDAEAAFLALRSLAESPQRAIPLLRAKVAPVLAPDEAQLKATLAALDSNDFAERERATADLAKLGALVEASLRELRRTTTSAEVKQRIDGLLERLASAEPTSDEMINVRAIEIAEWASTPEAVKLLESWASGAATARLTVEARAALTRLGKR